MSFSQKAIILIIVLILALSPFVGADIIPAGYHYLEITNKITNMQNYSSYDIVSIGSLGTTSFENSTEMCPPKIINSDGIVPRSYKFCTISLYVVNKKTYTALTASHPSNYTEHNYTVYNYTTHNYTVYKNYTIQTSSYNNDSVLMNYIRSNGVLIANGIITSMLVPDSYLKTNITIDMALQSSMVITPNYPVYSTLPNKMILIFLSLIGIIVIVLILYYRKRKKNA